MKAERAPRCRYHCRACGAHFSSLEAFDAHRVGPSDDRRCELADAPITEIDGGTCKIADPTTPQIGVTIYEHKRANRAREAFDAERREAA